MSLHSVVTWRPLTPQSAISDQTSPPSVCPVQVYAEKAAGERDADKRDMQRRLVDRLTAAMDKVEATVKQGGDLTEAKQVSAEHGRGRGRGAAGVEVGRGGQAVRHGLVTRCAGTGAVGGAARRRQLKRLPEMARLV